MSRAWNFRFPVRLACGHLVTFSGTAPWPGEAVWCTRCDAGAAVRAFYYDRDLPTGWCELIAGDGKEQLRCTLDKYHPGAKHYDGPMDAWFVADDRLRSGSEGSCA